MGKFSPRELEILSKIVTNPEGRVFCITGLDPELAGGALARYSRAPTGFKETILREFVDKNGEPNVAKGSALMDRVLNKFGDESVGELAGTHLCLEGISNLLTKIVEDRRIGGSPIEESTRYVLYNEQIDADEQVGGRWRYVRPTSIMESGLGDLFTQTMDFFFETYAAMVDPMKSVFMGRLPREKFTISVDRGGEKIDGVHEKDLVDDNERRAFKYAYNFTIRSAACDVIRCVLPAATEANVGLFANGRFYANLLNRLRSEELQEANELADLIRTELDKVIPTYVKREGRREYIVEVNQNMRALANGLLQGVPVETAPEVVLYEDHPEDLADNLVAEMLFPFARHPTNQLRQIVRNLSEEKKAEIRATYFGNRKDKRDRPERSLEFGYPINFDVVGGFAEYRDLHRHRMLTQQRQELGVDLGYSIPGEIGEIGALEKVQECFQRSENLHGELTRAGLVREAQYAALFNHLIRWRMGMVPREIGHLCELRSIRAGHPKYRRIVQIMAKQYLDKHPEMEPLLSFVDNKDYDDKIARVEQEARTAYKSLVTGVSDDID